MGMRSNLWLRLLVLLVYIIRLICIELPAMYASLYEYYTRHENPGMSKLVIQVFFRQGALNQIRSNIAHRQRPTATADSQLSSYFLTISSIIDYGYRHSAEGIDASWVGAFKLFDT